MSGQSIPTVAIRIPRPDNENVASGGESQTFRARTANDLRPANLMWECLSRSPENLYQITILFSDCGEEAGADTAHPIENDHYSQPRALFSRLTRAQRQHLYDSLSVAMQDVPEAIVERQVAEFGKIDPAYGAGVLAAVMRARRCANSGSLQRFRGLSPLSHAAE